MVKAGVFGFFGLSLLALTACQSGSFKKAGDAYSESPVEFDSSTPRACLLWRKPLGAHISHLSLDPFARALVVSTSAGESLRWIEPRTGKTVWTQGLPQPAKAQSISQDAKLFAASTYNGKITVWNSAGKKLWTVDQLARPVLTQKALIALNDDDADPFTGFFTYTLKGERTAMVAISPESGVEPVDLFVSNDNSSVLLSLSNDQLEAYASEGRPLWRAKLEGRIVSATTHAAETSPVFVLQQKKSHQILRALKVSKDKSVDELWSRDFDERFETVRLAGKSLFLYGNSHHGQAIAGVNTENGNVEWKHSYSAPANYSSLVLSGAESPFITAAIEDATNAGMIELMRLNSKGKADWIAQIEAPDGIYSYAYAENAGLLAVGAGSPGKGVVEMYSTNAKVCPKH